MPTNFEMQRTRWAVIWVKPGPEIVQIDFDHDFVSARELYEKVLRAGKKMPTLHCTNYGFPPPERLEDKMERYNRKGVYWCPYCMELRRFERRAWREGLTGKLYKDDPEYFCPICDIPSKNWAVRKYNPAFNTRGRPKKNTRRRRNVRRGRS